jgi:TonB-linked SusC/RagA family outer membrane protein
MKKLRIPWIDDGGELKKIVLRMKLSSCLLLLTFLQVSAHVRSQDRLTITLKNIGWSSFFDLLEKKSNYTFVYKDNVLPRNEKIDVEARALTVPEILDNVLRRSPLRYQLLPNRLVVITSKEDAGAAPGSNDIRVTGRVVAASGEPLAGATVRVKGGAAATSTDSTGVFALSVPEDAVLVISYVGYQSQEMPVSGRARVDITLVALPGNINEVVVIGYGTARKRDLTGAVSTINAKDINNIPVGGADQIMQGKAPGVSVTQTTGAPGDGVSVRIRGVGTINNNDPLYIVDGVPTKDGINEISPNDIESFSVLKDASSASIYGARASNGVVIITTKKGVTGKPRLNLNAYAGVQTRGHMIPMADTKQYVNAYNVAATNDGRPLIPPGMLDSLPDVNWQKEILKSAPIYDAQLSISGGSENTRYIISANYFGQKGMIMNSGNDRGNIRTAITSNLSKIFHVGTNLNLAYTKTRQVGSSGDGYSQGAGAGNPGASVVRYALFRTPATPVYDKNGNYVDIPNPSAFFGDGLNPVGLAANTDRNFYNYTLLGDVYVDITPIDHLHIKSDIGTNEILTEYKQFFPTWGGGGSGPQGRLQNSPNSLAQSYTNNFNYNWTNTATYDWLMGPHVFNFLAGTEIVYNDTRVLSASNTGFPNQTAAFQYLSNGTSTTPGVGGAESSWALSSLFGRIGYAFKDKYLGTFNFRRDGSSRLDPNNQWGNFYSGSVGWRIDKEKFMENIKPVSLLKLRASLGQLGNQEIPNYGYASLINSTGNYPFGTTPLQTYTIYQKGNPHVRWETSTIGDVGIDLGLLDGALSITADYYHKETSNLLVNPPDPSSAGAVAAAAYQNNGKVLNTGFEFEVNYHRSLSRDWQFNVTGNLATVNNKVLSLINNQPLPAGRIDNNVFATSTAVGHPIGAFYLLEDDGLFQSEQEVFVHAYQGAGVKPGDVKFRDINNDGVIDQKDRVYAGSPIPKITYGLTGTLSFQEWDLSLFFQGVEGNKIYNQVNTDIEGFYRAFNITERVATKSWNGAGTSNTLPRLSWTGAQNNKQASTRFLEDGSYTRLKNVQLGYNLSTAALRKLRISSMRWFVSAQNLFTVTKYTGQDPEMGTSANSAGDGVKAVGIDWGTYPSARTFTAGVNLNF